MAVLYFWKLNVKKLDIILEVSFKDLKLSAIFIFSEELEYFYFNVFPLILF